MRVTKFGKDPFTLAFRNFFIGIALGNIGVIIPIVQQRSLKPILKRLSTVKHCRLAIALFQFTCIYKFLHAFLNHRHHQLLKQQQRRKRHLEIDVTIVDNSHNEKNGAASFQSATFWSAAAAGTCILVLPQAQRIEYTLTAVARSFDILITKYVSQNGRFISNQSQFLSNVSTIVFILSAWEIIWSWFYYPQSLPKSYVKWITRMSEIDTDLLKFLRYMKEGKIRYNDEVGYGLEAGLAPYCERQGVDPDFADVRNGFVECNPVVHNGLRCYQHSFQRSFSGFKKSVLIYFPLYFSIFVFSLLKTPTQRRLGDMKALSRQILVIFISSIRSSLFLSAFIGIIWTVECQVRNFLRDDTIYGPLLGSALSGLSILIERPSRRAELAYYCLPRALYSLIYRIIWKNIKYSQNKGIWMSLLNMSGLVSFCFSIGTIVHQSFHSPQNVRPMMRILVTYLLEKP
jgi:hypothetical protein